MTVDAIKGDASVRLIKDIDYIVKDFIFTVINEKYLPVQTKHGMENVWNFSVKYGYELR